MEKLSTGLRINKAGDDAAGLAVSEKMRAQIRGMEQAERNVQDGISMVQTAEGALEEAGNIAQRMRELGIQAGNDTLSSDDRSKIKSELDQLQKEMGDIAKEAKFNGKELLTKAAADTTFTIQAGANTEVREIRMTDLSAIADSIKATDVSTVKAAQSFVEKIDDALEAINSGRSTLGAMQNRLEYTSNNLTTTTENLSAAESRIRDVDVAKEMVKLSKLNILNQASQAMVSQAKQQPESVTQLLR